MFCNSINDHYRKNLTGVKFYLTSVENIFMMQSMKYYKLSEIAKKLKVDRKKVYYWKDLGLFKVVVKFDIMLVSESEFKKLRTLVRNR